MKKKIALIITAFLLLSALISCDLLPSTPPSDGKADNDETKKGTEAQTEQQTDHRFSGWWDSSFDNTLATDKPTEKPTAAPTEKPTNPSQTEKFTAVIPVETLDFEGDTLKILHRDSRLLQREWYKDTAEDDLDEIIAMRNEAAAETLNIDVQYEAMASSNYEDCLNTFTNAIKEDVDNDFHYYDIVANYAYAGANVAVRDYIANLADKEVFPYFEFSLPCWNQSIVNNAKCNGQLYYITGDLNLSTFDKSMVIFLNKTMYDQKKGADDPEDLQDLALEGYNSVLKQGQAGGFTYDDLYRWSTVVEETNDKSGYQHDDFHAISSAFSSVPIDALPYAWDLEYISTEADGSHSYNIISNNKIKEAVTKAQELLDGSINGGVCNDDNTASCSLGGYTEPIAHFAADKSIFALHLLYNTEEDNTTIREMSSEYGLLPMPKYDTDQINYGTTSHDSYTLITVVDHSNSSTPTKGEMISAYLQYSAEESYTNVRFHYINRIVKPKYFGTDDTNGSVTKSIQIFNIIADNIEFSFASIYAPQLGGVLSSCWRDVVDGEHTTNATTAEDAYKSDQATFDELLEEVDTWLGLRDSSYN